MTGMPRSGHELSITRLIDAPPEIVYRVWTQRTREWWAPKPYTTPVVEWDLRPGGRSRTVMKSPEGEDMPHEGVFLEVVPNERLVRSEEHTSELQSLMRISYAVFCLKKKKKHDYLPHNKHTISNKTTNHNTT